MRLHVDRRHYAEIKGRFAAKAQGRTIVSENGPKLAASLQRRKEASSILRNPKVAPKDGEDERRV